MVAFDADNDTLTYSAIGLPAGLEIDANTGVITGTPTVSGTGSVVIAVSDGATSSSAALTWAIDAETTLVLDPMPKQAPLLVDASTTYAATSHDGVNTRYKWYFGDGSESAWSSSPTVTHTFTRPTLFWVTVTARDDRGVMPSQTFAQLVHLPLTPQRPAVSGNLALGGGRLWVVNQDNDSVSAFDVASNQKLGEVNVGTAPRAVAVSPSGEVWVTNRQSASISVINPATLSVSRTIGLPAASQPFGIAFVPDGSAAFVALEAIGQVLKLDPVSGNTLGTATVGGAPRHVSVSADSNRVYVSRFITARLPGEATAAVATTVNGADRGAEVWVLNTGDSSRVTTIVLKHSDDSDFENQGSGIPNYLGAAVISPDGASAWVPSKKDNVKRGSLRSGVNLNHQNTVRAISSRIDLGSDSEVFAARMDHDNASLASAGAFDPYGVFLFVALETSREVAVVDAQQSCGVLPYRRRPRAAGPGGFAGRPPALREQLHGSHCGCLRHHQSRGRRSVAGAAAGDAPGSGHGEAQRCRC